MKSSMIASACMGLVLNAQAAPQDGYYASTTSSAPCSTPTPAPEEAPSLCDKYTTALLVNNTGDNQLLLLTLIVHTAIIGNYTQPNVGIAVPGLLSPGTGDFEGVNLLPYFTGELESSNFGGDSGVSGNFLDGGAADALKNNVPANDPNSFQYHLLTHLYAYFGGLLGCSKFPYPYEGRKSMYETHQFMALDEKEVGWFITNVGLSAASFGVTDEDVTAVGTALQTTFGVRCSPPATVVPPTADPSLQSICIEDTCPLADAPVCQEYFQVVEPVVNSTAAKLM